MLVNPNLRLKTVKTLLVDDHQLFIDGIKSILNNENNVDVVGQATTGQEALEFLANNPIDLVLTDMSMPNMTGIELTRVIRSKFPTIKVIVLSMNKRKSLIQDAMASGASGYVLKDASKEELGDCVATVLSGDTFLSRGVGKILLSSKQELQPDQDLANLTNRETEILKLISEELSNIEVAKRLSISRRTVETHRKNIMRKVGVKNSVGLAKYAYSHGLME